MSYLPPPAPPSRMPPAIKALLASLGLGAVLIACSASRENESADAAGQCNVARAEHLIGENLNAQLEQQALADSGASQIRVLKPDSAATMDFNPRRLNLHVDPGLVVIQVACG
ncbi:I78 family peptidase inhibitor [Herbaspirillum rubrisubalbicans]|nr:I78 family peptidase inhibitor [Herbaspirillum rubrisubalbicans]